MEIMRARWSSRGQRGQSLIEIIIAVLMLGSVFLVLVGGMFTLNEASETNERIQTVDSALIAYGEILRSKIPYRPCAGGYESGAVATDYAQDATDSIDGSAADNWLKPPAMILDLKVLPGATSMVESWDPVARDFAPACIKPDTGVQRVSYSVTFQQCPVDNSGNPTVCPEPWRQITRTGQVIKRKDGPS